MAMAAMSRKLLSLSGIARRSPLPFSPAAVAAALRLGLPRGMSAAGPSLPPPAGRGGGGGGSGSLFAMNFVQGVVDEHKLQSQRARIRDPDVVHITLKRKKTFVTVTDSMGNRKTGASGGCLEGQSRRSRYAAVATAEHVGRQARKMGLKSVVVKVKGYTFFGRKKKTILGFRDGFKGDSVKGMETSPIVAIHEVTQLPHNGCRLRKKVRK